MQSGHRISSLLAFPPSFPPPLFPPSVATRVRMARVCEQYPNAYFLARVREQYPTTSTFQQTAGVYGY